MTPGRCLPLALTVTVTGTAAILAGTDSALAHGDVQPNGRDVLTAWHVEWPVLVMWLGAAALYWAGARTVWLRHGRWHGVRRRDVGSFVAGMLVLLVALGSPLDALAGELISMHMVQHVVLLFVVAPLLVWSRATIAMGALGPRALRSFSRRPVARAIVHPATAWILMMGVMWGWHVPKFYEGAVASPALHGIEHLSMLGAALVWWHAVLHRAGHRVFPFGLAIPWVFTSMLGMSALAALMAFSPSPWYPGYVHPAGEWPVGAVTDQQLAGLAMWSISNVVQLAVVLWLVGKWFTVEERRAARKVGEHAALS